MIAHFYLHEHSFRCPNDTELFNLTEKINQLRNDVDYIRQYKDTNLLFKHESIYDQHLFNGLSVADILYCGKGKAYFDRDVLESLRRIIEIAEDDTLSSKEISILLDRHTSSQAFGFLCLHPINGVETKFLIYSKNTWLDFHRFFLGMYPQSITYFFEGCKRYFPDLFFHEQIASTLKPMYPNFVKKIIWHLTALHDEFHKHKNSPYQRINTLQSFSSACQLDETASSEGDLTRKKDFTFTFLNNLNQPEEICCEPHLKLSKSDNIGDSKYYFYRIYFHEGKANIANNHMLIVHIGEHL